MGHETNEIWHFIRDLERNTKARIVALEKKVEALETRLSELDTRTGGLRVIGSRID
jgi:hypothetical protein